MINYRSLASMACNAAIDIDNYIRGSETDFSGVREFTEIIGENLIRDSDSDKITGGFPYLALAEAMRKNSDKEIKYVSELALEMRFFYSELSDLENLSEERLKSLRSFCVKTSDEILTEHELNYCWVRV